MPEAILPTPPTPYTTHPAVKAWCQRPGASPMAVCTHILCWQAAPKGGR